MRYFTKSIACARCIGLSIHDLHRHVAFVCVKFGFAQPPEPHAVVVTRPMSCPLTFYIIAPQRKGACCPCSVQSTRLSVLFIAKDIPVRLTWLHICNKYIALYYIRPLETLDLTASILHWD